LHGGLVVLADATIQHAAFLIKYSSAILQGEHEHGHDLGIANMLKPVIGGDKYSQNACTVKSGTMWHDKKQNVTSGELRVD
jgi:hypothetical protein